MVNYAPKVKRSKIQRSTPNIQSGNPTSSPSIDPDHLTTEVILQLQRQFGNQYVMRLLNDKQNTEKTQRSSTLPIQRKANGVIQRGKKDGYTQLPDEEDDTDFTSMDTLDESIEDNDTEEEDNQNGDPKDWVKFDGSDDNSDDPFKDFDKNFNQPNMDNSYDQKKGQNPNIEVDKHGYSGKFGKVKAGVMGTHQGYKGVNYTSQLVSDETIGTNVGKGMNYLGGQMEMGIDKVLGTNLHDDKVDGKTQSTLFGKIKSAVNTIINAIKDAVNANFGVVIEAIGKVKDVLEQIAKYGVPIVSTVFSVVSSAYSVYTGWTTYKAFDIASKEAQEILEANEDDTDDLDAPLLKDKSTKKSSKYAAAKTWRAFLSKIFSFATTLGKGLSQIASLFTGGLTEIGEIGFGLLQAAKTGMDWLKALYKIAKGTKGKNRALHANTIMESADQGNQQALKLLLDLGLTGDIWMLKLAAKMGVEYDPTYKDYTEVLGSSFLGKGKNKFMKFASSKATKKANQVEQVGKDLAPYQGKIPTELAKKIKSQFIKTNKETALALLIEPRTTEEMHAYLKNLKEVGMYQDFSKELMTLMKSK